MLINNLIILRTLYFYCTYCSVKSSRYLIKKYGISFNKIIVSLLRSNISLIIGWLQVKSIISLKSFIPMLLLKPQKQDKVLLRTIDDCAPKSSFLRNSNNSKYLYYCHLNRGDNHYQYYIRTANFIQDQLSNNNKELFSWFRFIKEKETISNKNTVNIIVSPSHFSNEAFVSAINQHVFEGKAYIINFDVKKEFRSSFEAKYSNYKVMFELALNDYPHFDKIVNFYFIDDNIVTGDTYHRTKSLIGFYEEEEYRFLISNSVDISSRNKQFVFDNIINYSEDPKNKKPFINIKFGRNYPTEKDSKSKVADDFTVKQIRILGNDVHYNLWKDQITQLTTKNATYKKLFEQIKLIKEDCEQKCIIIGEAIDEKQKEIFQLLDGLNFSNKEKTPIWCEGHLPLRSITISPSINEEQVFNMLNHYCKHGKYWLKYVKINKSTIPYRST